MAGVEVDPNLELELIQAANELERRIYAVRQRFFQRTSMNAGIQRPLNEDAKIQVAGYRVTLNRIRGQLSRLRKKRSQTMVTQRRGPVHRHRHGARRRLPLHRHLHGRSASLRQRVPYAFPRQRKEPLDSPGRIRNALARFNQVRGVTLAERAAAFRRIKAAARRHRIHVSARSFRDLL